MPREGNNRGTRRREGAENPPPARKRRRMQTPDYRRPVNIEGLEISPIYLHSKECLDLIGQTILGLLATRTDLSYVGYLEKDDGSLKAKVKDWAASAQPGHKGVFFLHLYDESPESEEVPKENRRQHVLAVKLEKLANGSVKVVSGDSETNENAIIRENLPVVEGVNATYAASNLETSRLRGVRRGELIEIFKGLKDGGVTQVEVDNQQERYTQSDMVSCGALAAENFYGFLHNKRPKLGPGVREFPQESGEKLWQVEPGALNYRERIAGTMAFYGRSGTAEQKAIASRYSQAQKEFSSSKNTIDFQAIRSSSDVVDKFRDFWKEYEERIKEQERLLREAEDAEIKQRIRKTIMRYRYRARDMQAAMNHELKNFSSRCYTEEDKDNVFIFEDETGEIARITTEGKGQNQIAHIDPVPDGVNKITITLQRIDAKGDLIPDSVDVIVFDRDGRVEEILDSPSGGKSRISPALRAQLAARERGELDEGEERRHTGPPAPRVVPEERRRGPQPPRAVREEEPAIISVPATDSSIATLEEELARMRSEKATLKAERDRLNEEAERLRKAEEERKSAALSPTSPERATPTSEHYERQKRELNGLLDKRESDIKDLRQKLMDATKTQRGLEDRIRHQDQRMADMQADLTHARNLLANQERYTEEAELETEELKAELKLQEGLFNLNKKWLEQARGENEALESQVNEAKKQKRALEDQLREAQANAKKSDPEVEKLKKASEEQKKKLAELAEARKAAKLLTEELEKENKGCKEEITKLQGDKARLEKAVEREKAALNEKRDEFYQKQEELDTARTQLREADIAHGRAIEAKDAEHAGALDAQAKAHKEQMKTQKDYYELKLDEVQGEIALLQARHKRDIKRTRKTEEQRITEIRDKHQEEMAKAFAKEGKLDEELSAKRTQIAELQAQLEGAKDNAEKVVPLKKELEQRELAIERMEEEKEKLQKENRKLKGEHKLELESQRKSADRAFDKLMVTHQEAMKEKQQQLRQTEEKVSKLEGEMQALLESKNKAEEERETERGKEKGARKLLGTQAIAADRKAAELQEQFAAAQKQLWELQDKQKHLGEELNKAQEQLHSKEAELKQTEERHAAENKKLIEQHEEQTKKALAAQKAKTRKKEKGKGLLTELEHEDDLAEAERKLEAEKRRNEEDREKAAKRVSEARDQTDKERAKVIALESEKAELESQNRALQRKIEELTPSTELKDASAARAVAQNKDRKK